VILIEIFNYSLNPGLLFSVQTAVFMSEKYVKKHPLAMTYIKSSRSGCKVTFTFWTPKETLITSFIQ